MRMHASPVLIVAAAFALSACHTRPPAVAPMTAPGPVSPMAGGARPPAPPRVGPSRSSSSSAPLSEEEIFRRTSLDELNAEQPLGDAFFDYNQADLRDDARAALQKDATWLAKWTSTKIRIDGHCDERGTAEYNLALGQRRAAAVRDYLVSLGVDTSRITTTSLGKEQPFCTTGDTDACWSQNRRGHFVITAK